VAEHCLGNAGHAQGARALREAREGVSGGRDARARVAAAAARLGLVEDAEGLLEAAGDWGRLGELYRAAGEWGRAASLAATRDPGRLRACRVGLARDLEAANRLDEAAAAYMAAGRDCAAAEVPRMLLAAAARARREGAADGAAHEEDRLREWCSSRIAAGDLDVARWWGGWREAEGDLPGALAVYEKSPALAAAAVRLRCAAGDLAGAEALVDGLLSRSPGVGAGAAAFALAVQYEGMDLVEEAVRWFRQSGRPAYALRLALRRGDAAGPVDLGGLAAECGPEERAAAATALEARGDVDGAVRLYEAAGQRGRALDLCFRLGRHAALDAVAEGLGADADPALLLRCADQLERSGRPGRAAKFLALAGERERALDALERGASAGGAAAEGRVIWGGRGGRRGGSRCRCPGDETTRSRRTSSHPQRPRPSPLVPHSHPPFPPVLLSSTLRLDALDERTAELLSPPKDPPGTDPEPRRRALARLAGLLLRAGAHHLACKKFVQAGDKPRGMRALLRSGDRRRIVFFATTARDDEVRLLAAEWLRTLDWRSEPGGASGETATTAATMLTKAGSHAGAGAFYEEMAEAEVEAGGGGDDAYARAGRWLTEAGAAWGRAAASGDGGGADNAEGRRTAAASAVERIATLARARAAFVAAGSADADADADAACVELLNATVSAPLALPRAADVFALLVERLARAGDLAQALAVLDKARARGISTQRPPFDQDTVGRIHSTMGVPMPSPDEDGRRGGVGGATGSGGGGGRGFNDDDDDNDGVASFRSDEDGEHGANGGCTAAEVAAPGGGAMSTAFFPDLDSGRVGGGGAEDAPPAFFSTSAAAAPPSQMALPTTMEDDDDIDGSGVPAGAAAADDRRATLAALRRDVAGRAGGFEPTVEVFAPKDGAPASSRVRLAAGGSSRAGFGTTLDMAPDPLAPAPAPAPPSALAQGALTGGDDDGSASLMSDDDAL